MILSYHQYTYSLSNDDVIIHFHIVKLTILGLFIRKFMWNLRGTKCRAQQHNNRKAVVVWVSPVAAKRQ